MSRTPLGIEIGNRCNDKGCRTAAIYSARSATPRPLVKPMVREDENEGVLIIDDTIEECHIPTKAN